VNRSLDLTLLVLLVATALLAIMVAFKDLAMLGMALQKSGRLFLGVWPELLLGFVLAGLIDVLVPEAVLMRWLGEQHLGYGILAGWVLGLLLPGGPYLLFPLVANLMRQGAAPGPLIALLTAKVLLSQIRMVSYEAPPAGMADDTRSFCPKLSLAAGDCTARPLAVSPVP